MTSRECLCNEDSEDYDSAYETFESTLNPQDFEDFVQEVLHYKCKVVQLVQKQIEKSKKRQICLLLELEETSKNGEKKDQEKPRDKRKTDNDAVSAASENFWQKIGRFLRSHPIPVLLVALLLTVLYFTKGGSCIPLYFKKPSRPRPF